MRSTLIRALVLAAPICGLVGWSVVLVVRQRSVFTILQFVGAGCLFVTVLAHVCEGLGILPFMGWGRRDSVGHYLDLSKHLSRHNFGRGWMVGARASTTTPVNTALVGRDNNEMNLTRSAPAEAAALAGYLGVRRLVGGV